MPPAIDVPICWVSKPSRRKFELSPSRSVAMKSNGMPMSMRGSTTARLPMMNSRTYRGIARKNQV